MAKGASFERTVMRLLSEWWTDGERDDVFWRTATSGGRATQRGKVGKATFGQYGDVQAVDPVGQSLIDACSFELKIGYNKWSHMDVLDKLERGAAQTFEKFVEQAFEQCKAAGARWPVLITKRDKRDPLITFPSDLWEAVATWRDDREHAPVYVVARIHPDQYPPLITVRLDTFFTWCHPTFFTECVAKWRPLTKPGSLRRSTPE